MSSQSPFSQVFPVEGSNQGCFNPTGGWPNHASEFRNGDKRFFRLPQYKLRLLAVAALPAAATSEVANLLDCGVNRTTASSPPALGEVIFFVEAHFPQ